MRREYYALWLHTIPGIGSLTIQKLLRYAKKEEAVYMLGERELERLLDKRQQQSFRRWREEKDPERLYRLLSGKDIDFVPLYAKRYPERLKQLPDPPYGLFMRGRFPEEERGTAAIIGARNCSTYGRDMAAYFASVLAENGIQVVSGLARGIDGIAQKSAMDAGGSSFGVLGCGIDICYPPENAALYEQCLEAGGILSEYPPGRAPAAGMFPARNRIISGLCDAVLVIEARERSGTLITVDLALEQGREVFALPGRVNDALSAGCNRLIAQGAAMALSPQDVIEYMMERQAKRANERNTGSQRRIKQEGARDVEERERAGGEGARVAEAHEPAFQEREKLLLWRLTEAYPKSFGQLYEEVAAETAPQRPPVQIIMQYLAELLVDGYVMEKGNNYYYRSVWQKH